MKYICVVCGYIYDEERKGVSFDELPNDWRCPSCGALKMAFVPFDEKTQNEQSGERKVS